MSGEPFYGSIGVYLNEGVYNSQTVLHFGSDDRQISTNPNIHQLYDGANSYPPGYHFTGMGTVDGVTYTFDSLESTTNNYVYYASGTGAYLDGSGISFHSAATSDQPNGVDFHLYADMTSLTGYTLTSSIGAHEAVSLEILCFVAGALIATPGGQVPVERLAVGDLVTTASGAARRIAWLGHRTIRPGGRVGRDAWPVRIRADAFGPARPARDLWLSPGHAVCVDVVGEVLVPVGKLANGATIAPVEVEEVTYCHVGLDSHDLLVAEGLVVESYMACEGRDWLAGGDGRPDPVSVEASKSDYCRPFHEEGPLVEAVRARLKDRAEALGWRSDRTAALHLLADGVRIEAEVGGDGVASFGLPAGGRDVRLVSPAFVPALWNARGDERKLGLLVAELGITDEFGTDRAIGIDDPRLSEGFYALETHAGRAWRWTDGDARLPPELWAGCSGPLRLRVAFDPRGSRTWLPPAAAETDNVIQLRAA